ASRTPGRLLSARSLRLAQAAQCMPPMSKRATLAPKLCWMGAAVMALPFPLRRDDDFRVRRHHAHAAVERVFAGPVRCEGDERRAVARKNFLNPQARGHENARASIGFAGIDPPVDGDALRHGELVRLVVETDHLHADALRVGRALWLS